MGIQELVPGLLTDSAIQAAIDKVEADGGGTVLLGPVTYVCKRTIDIDCTRVSLIGNSTVLDFSKAGDIPFIDFRQKSDLGYKQGARQRFSGFTVRGKDKWTGTALNFKTVQTGNDWSTSIKVEDVVVEKCKIGINIDEGAYLVRFDNVTVGWCGTCVCRPLFKNNGEAIGYYGCTFFNSDLALELRSSNQDHYFYNCSFDYNKRVIYTDGPCEFHGCHFESNSGATGNTRQFEADNGGRCKFFGGEISLVTGNSSIKPDYLFTSYPTNGGGWFDLVNTDIGKYLGNQFSVAICNEPTKFTRTKGLNLTEYPFT